MEAAREGQPQIVWIEGDAGIGKTAFIRRFPDDGAGCQVLQASGEESETTLDYGVVLQLVAQATPADELARARGADRPALAGQLVHGRRRPARHPRLRSRTRAPVVLVVDDAHWLDPSSAAALLFVLRRLHGDRLLVLIGSRPGGVESPRPGVVAAAGGPRPRRRASRLAGLSGTEVSELRTRSGSAS